MVMNANVMQKMMTVVIHEYLIVALLFRNFHGFLNLEN
jgi:hypothetical protein